MEMRKIEPNTNRAQAESKDDLGSQCRAAAAQSTQQVRELTVNPLKHWQLNVPLVPKLPMPRPLQPLWPSHTHCAVLEHTPVEPANEQQRELSDETQVCKIKHNDPIERRNFTTPLTTTKA